MNIVTQYAEDDTESAAATSFIAAMIDAGLPSPGVVVADGQPHRFSTSADGGDEDGYYVLTLSGRPRGHFGCERTGKRLEWHPGQQQGHAYLNRKEISLQELCDACYSQVYIEQGAVSGWEGPILYRELVFAAGQHAGYERILPERIQKGGGNKPNDKFVTRGTKVSGSFTPLGFHPDDLLHLEGRLVVCAGLADGFSIHQASGWPVACAVGENMVASVVKTLRTAAPHADLLAAVDNDKAGHRAGKRAGVAWTCPSRMKDWSDVRQEAGLQAVRDQLLETPAVNDEHADEEPSRPGVVRIPDSCRDMFVVRHGLDLARVTEMPEATAVMTALGAFSGIAGAAFATGYPDGQRLPLGLYVVAEQPPATAKSRLLNSLVTPWMKLIKRFNAEQLAAAEEAAEVGEKVAPQTMVFPFSNATPEAMEQAMATAGTGHFFLQSAEQGSIRLLFGDGVRDRPKNFDLALKGFNGEFHASARVSRQKLEREVFGGITVLAQSGSIRTILANSDGDGLAERFLHIAEPHNLGRRTHAHQDPDNELRASYERSMSAVMDGYRTLTDQGDLDSLHYVGLTPSGREMLRQHKIRNEGRIAHHADNGEMVMTAFIGKADIQAMKVAATLYLGDCLSAGRPYRAEVPDTYVAAGLELVDELLAHVEQVMVSLDKIGPEAAREAVRRQFDKKDVRTMRELTQNLKKVKPFKDNPQPIQYVRRIVTGMINRGDLTAIGKELRLG